MTEHKIPIPGRIYNASGGNVCGTDDVIDDVKGKKQSQINTEVYNAIQNEIERATEAENDRYTKSEVYKKEETYNKTELNNLITTPSQEYETYVATDQTTAATDVLPATGEADTIYRVGNWDGTQYDTTCYTEYAWNGSVYVSLNTKEYGIDDVPTPDSTNLVTSGGIFAKTNGIVSLYANGWILTDGSISTSSTGRIFKYVVNNKNSILKIQGEVSGGGSSLSTRAAYNIYNANNELLGTKLIGASATSFDEIVNLSDYTNPSYIYICSANGYEDETKVFEYQGLETFAKDIKEIKEAINDADSNIEELENKITHVNDMPFVLKDYIYKTDSNYGLLSDGGGNKDSSLGINTYLVYVGTLPNRTVISINGHNVASNSSQEARLIGWCAGTAYDIDTNTTNRTSIGAVIPSGDFSASYTKIAGDSFIAISSTESNLVVEIQKTESGQIDDLKEHLSKSIVLNYVSVATNGGKTPSGEDVGLSVANLYKYAMPTDADVVVLTCGTTHGPTAATPFIFELEDGTFVGGWDYNGSPISNLKVKVPANAKYLYVTLIKTETPSCVLTIFYSNKTISEHSELIKELENKTEVLNPRAVTLFGDSTGGMIAAPLSKYLNNIGYTFYQENRGGMATNTMGAFIGAMPIVLKNKVTIPTSGSVDFLVTSSLIKEDGSSINYKNLSGFDAVNLRKGINPVKIAGVVGTLSNTQNNVLAVVAYNSSDEVITGWSYTSFGVTQSVNIQNASYIKVCINAYNADDVANSDCHVTINGTPIDIKQYITNAQTALNGSGTAVTLDGYYTSSNIAVSANITSVYIDGCATPSTFTFTRSEAGDAIVAEKGTTIYSDNYELFKNSIVLGYVNNFTPSGRDIWKDWAYQAKKLCSINVFEKCIFACTHYLFGDYSEENISKIENSLIGEFGNKFFSGYEYLKDSGLSDAVRYGVYTQEEIEALGGTWKSVFLGSESNPDVHENAQAGYLLARKFIEIGVELGYWPDGDKSYNTLMN